jgi:hypothetical protein
VPRKTKGEDDGSQDRQVIISGINIHARERSVALNTGGVLHRLEPVRPVLAVWVVAVVEVQLLAVADVAQRATINHGFDHCSAKCKSTRGQGISCTITQGRVFISQSTTAAAPHKCGH